MVSVQEMERRGQSELRGPEAVSQHGMFLYPALSRVSNPPVGSGLGLPL